jgi:hypothetical protein
MSVCSEHWRQFIKGSGAAKMVGSRVNAEFVVATAKVLDERVTCDDYRRGSVRLQASHRP